MGDKAVLGIFSYVDDTCKAIDALYRAGFKNIVAYTPIPVHEIEHALEKGRPVFEWNLSTIGKTIRNRDFHLHRITFTGAIVGILAAVGLFVGTALDWPLWQGGFPLVSLPPMGLISYETMTLFGAIFSVLGLMWLSKLPSYYKDEVYDISLSEDKFGLAVKANISKEAANAEQIMTKAGANKVELKEGVLRE